MSVTQPPSTAATVDTLTVATGNVTAEARGGRLVEVWDDREGRGGEGRGGEESMQVRGTIGEMKGHRFV